MNTCTKCGHKAVAIAGTRHRRCPGKGPAIDANGKNVPRPLRPKHGKLSVAERGTWS